MSEPGVAIRATREGVGLTLRELAQLSGTSYAYLSLVERGKRTPTERWLRDVKEALAACLIEDEGAA